MPINKTMLCLANSRKPGGRCIAGKEIIDDEPGTWIRPVSARPTEEVSLDERQYEDGSDPRLLDVIEIPLIGPRPRHHQIENFVLHPDCYWEKIDTVSIDKLDDWVDNVDELWINGSHTNAGLNDRINEAQAHELTGSLVLIPVRALQLHVFAPGADFGNPKKRVQAIFKYRNVEYRLWATDPNVEDRYRAKGEGVYKLGESYITVSLAESHEGYCYKLAAAIFNPETL